MPPKTGVFLRRLLSSAVLWAALLAVLLPDSRMVADSVLLGLLMLVSTAGLAEFYGLGGKCELECFRKLGLSAGVLLTAGTFVALKNPFGSLRSPSALSDFEAGFFTLVMLGLCLWQVARGCKAAGAGALAVTLFGLMYVPWLLNFMQRLHFLPGIEPHGRVWVLYLIAVTKLGDSGGHLIGTLAGRHPMASTISPRKTWEGFAGEMLASVATSLALARLAGDKLSGMTLHHAAVLGVILGLAGVAGDLVESLFKREAGVKDSGQVFPGIGGVLDLIDSLLFTSPVMYLYARHVMHLG